VKKIDELRKIASSLSAHLTGSTRKEDIVDRIVGMAQIRAVRIPSEEDNAKDVIAISCLAEEVRLLLKSLTSFSSVADWGKKLSGVLAEFTFVIYLVYGQDKSFDMQALRAHKSLKAYKYSYDGYVKNVWVFQCPCENQLNLSVVFSCLCVSLIHH